MHRGRNTDMQQQEPTLQYGHHRDLPSSRRSTVAHTDTMAEVGVDEEYKEMGIEDLAGIFLIYGCAIVFVLAYKVARLRFCPNFRKTQDIQAENEALASPEGAPSGTQIKEDFSSTSPQKSEAARLQAAVDALTLDMAAVKMALGITEYSGSFSDAAPARVTVDQTNGERQLPELQSISPRSLGITIGEFAIPQSTGGRGNAISGIC